MKGMPDQNQNAHSFDYKIFVYKRLERVAFSRYCNYLKWNKVQFYLQKKNQDVLWNTISLAATVWKRYFQHEGQSQGHNVIDLGVIWKGIISWVNLRNMKPLSFTVPKL